MTMTVKGKRIGRKSNLQKDQEESKFLRRVSLKDVSSGTAIQVCVEKSNVKELFDSLSDFPQSIIVDYVKFRYAYRPNKSKVEVPKNLTQLCRVHRSISAGSEENIELAFSQITIKELIEETKKIAAYYKKPLDQFLVRVLRLREKDAVIHLEMVKKDIPASHDMRTKINVLAFTKTNRDPLLAVKAQKILSNFSTAKYMCKFHVEEKRVAICSKVE